MVNLAPLKFSPEGASDNRNVDMENPLQMRSDDLDPLYHGVERNVVVTYC